MDGLECPARSASSRAGTPWKCQSEMRRCRIRCGVQWVSPLSSQRSRMAERSPSALISGKTLPVRGSDVATISMSQAGTGTNLGRREPRRPFLLTAFRSSEGSSRGADEQPSRPSLRETLLRPSTRAQVRKRQAAEGRDSYPVRDQGRDTESDWEAWASMRRKPLEPPARGTRRQCIAVDLARGPATET